MTPPTPTIPVAPAIPTATLLEPSFLDLVAAIEQAKDLPEQTRRHWVCSLRQVAKWLDRPATVVPARWQAVRISVGQLHQARIGVTPKTLANHKSNVRAALRWFHEEQSAPQQGARLSPEWTRFQRQLERSIRQRLYNLVRYCSVRCIGPTSVDDTLFDEYWRYRADNTGRATNNTAKRFMVRAWNGCSAAMDGLPLQHLTEPPIKTAEPAWEKFPAGLRRDIDGYLAGFSKPHRTLNGQRIQPCRPSTIAYRRAELVAFCRTAVKLGVPIESLMDLGALLHPDVVERVLDAYWLKNGDEPTTGTIQLGWKLLRMAQTTGCLDRPAHELLDDMRVALEQHRCEGLTPKNLQLIRQVLTEGVWSDVVSLPKALMRQARLARDHAPIKAAVTAQLGVAIAIETFTPIRLRNLIGIELGKNLIKPGGLNTPYWLAFPNYDVKNRLDLNFKFDELLTDLIADVDEYRPTLLRGANSDRLFPGENGEPKNGLLFSKQITERIQKAVGLRITVHQFRHAAAAIYLKHQPGDYETVRRVLGHRSLTTTVKFYCGLETIAASEHFGKLIRVRIEFDDEPDA
jgi:site-specific recombinase XerD